MTKYFSVLKIICSTDEHINVLGWGKIAHPNGRTRMLQQAKMKVVSNSICDTLHRKTLGVPVTANMVCTGDNGVTPTMGCHGDSGGPLVCRINGKWELHGAVSHGSSTCDSKESFTVFTRINKYKSWINYIISN